MQDASSAMKFRNQMFQGISQICHDLSGEVKLETKGTIIDKSLSVSPKHQNLTTAWASGVERITWNSASGWLFANEGSKKEEEDCLLAWPQVSLFMVYYTIQVEDLNWELNDKGIDDEFCCVWTKSIDIKPQKTVYERKSDTTRHFIGESGQQLLLTSLYSSAKDGKP
ncbi:hypothetical protein SADUNF_Sadunf06G0162200 [Salix dunnii]|uniref:Uncharacterized protein n=1 Tax=Salix dunnii TaxID=1413687 RepID=A0A835K505_9ROSI|nr:hypothetical protein SADUNF_Sadunf06G0162200 [Salix dunnii]